MSDEAPAKESGPPPCAQCGQPSVGSLSVTFSPRPSKHSKSSFIREITRVANDTSFNGELCLACLEDLRQSAQRAIKRLSTAVNERRRLARVMETAHGSVSEGARLVGLDRTNFRRLLQRYGLRVARSVSHEEKSRG